MESNIEASQNMNHYPIQEQATLVEIWEYVSCECNDSCTCRRFGCTNHWTLKQNLTFRDILPAFLRMFVFRTQHGQIRARMNATTLTPVMANERFRVLLPVLYDIRDNWVTLCTEASNHRKTLICDDWCTSSWKDRWDFSVKDSVYKAKQFCILLPDVGIPYDCASRRRILYCLGNKVHTYLQLLSGLRDRIIDIMESESQTLVILRKLDSPEGQLPFDPDQISLPKGNINYGNTYTPAERPLSRIIDKFFFRPSGQREVLRRRPSRQPVRLGRQKTCPLSGRGKRIYWQNCHGGRRVYWGTRCFDLPDSLVSNILNNYFRDRKTWYSLGTHMTKPKQGGLGQYIKKNFSHLSPRYASAIAAILAFDNLIESRGKNPIKLRKL